MRITSPMTSIVLINILLAGCSRQVEEPSPTAIPTVTLAPAQPPTQTDTPTPMPEPTVTPMLITQWEDVTGIWIKSTGRQMRLSIYEDGRVSYWCEGYGEAFPILLWFEDGFLHARENTQEFCTQQIGTYEVSGVPGEYLLITVIDDPCAQDRMLRGKWIDKFSQ
jgi:hypothetical protein